MPIKPCRWRDLRDFDDASTQFIPLTASLLLANFRLHIRHRMLPVFFVVVPVAAFSAFPDTPTTLGRQCSGAGCGWQRPRLLQSGERRTPVVERQSVSQNGVFYGTKSVLAILVPFFVFSQGTRFVRSDLTCCDRLGRLTRTTCPSRAPIRGNISHNWRNNRRRQFQHYLWFIGEPVFGCAVHPTSVRCKCGKASKLFFQWTYVAQPKFHALLTLSFCSSHPFLRLRDFPIIRLFSC